MASGASAASKPHAASQCQACGPATVTLAQREVTGVTSTLKSVYSHCSHSSKAAAVRSAPAVVVLTQKCSGSEPRHDAVVDQGAVLVQQQPVARLTEASVDIVPTYMRSRKRAASGPYTSSLPSGEPSKSPALRAHGAGLALRRLLERLAGPRIGGRPAPVAEALDARPVGEMPGVRGQELQRPVQLAHAPPDEGAERHRHERRPEARRADHLRGLPAALAHEHERIDVAGLALVGPHAGGGVTLQMLDRAVVLAPGELDVGTRDIVLQVDELLAGKTGHARNRRAASPPRPPAARAPRHRVPAPRRSRRRGPPRPEGRTLPRRPRRSQGPAPHRPARTSQLAATQRSRPPAWECRCTAGAWPPALQDQVALDALGRAAHRLPPARRATVQPRTARWPATAISADPVRTGRPAAASAGASRRSTIAAICRPTGLQRPRGRVGRVAVGRDQHATPAGDAESRGVLARGAGQHDARAVIVRKEQRPLEGAGRRDHLPGADLPQPLAQHARRQVRRAFRHHGLERAHQVVVVDAEGTRVRAASARPRAARAPRAAAASSSSSPGERTAQRALLVSSRVRAPASAAADAAARPAGPPPTTSTSALGCELLVVIGVGARSGRVPGPPCGGSPARTSASSAT